MLAPRIPVAREGLPFIGFSALCTITFASLEMTASAIFCLCLTAFILYFFRDPERVLPMEENGLVSPADGRVLLVEQVDNSDFFQESTLKVSIFMNVFNVHVNRAPTSGKVTEVFYRPGRFHSADSKKGALENEYCATLMQTNSGKQLAFVQLAGLIARRIVCWLEPGDAVSRGMRYGLIRFGSRVDLYLPLETELRVKPGDRVRAGETLLGVLD